MPIIANLGGVTIRMFFNDHPPPHFHVQHGGDRAIMTIAEGRVIAGSLPLPVLRQVGEWSRSNHAALLDAWQRARLGQRLGEIPCQA